MAGQAITTSGIFTQPAVPVAQIINLRYAPDWIKIIDTTVAIAGTPATGYMYEWWAYMNQVPGAVPGNALITEFNAPGPVTASLTAMLPAGVTYYDTSLQTTTAGSTVTAISVGQVVTTASNAGLVPAGPGVPGSIVRFYNPTAQAAGGSANQMMGIDFSVTAVNANGVNFTIGYAAPNPVVAGAGMVDFYAVVPTYGSFYPRTRYISSISLAANAVVTFTVQHGYQIGQILRFQNPSNAAAPNGYGMPQINGLSGTVIAVNLVTNSVTVNINTLGFTPFAWPTTATASNVNYQYAEVIPYGENTGVAESLAAQILGDSVMDEGFIGFILSPGAGFAGGAGGDTSIWMAGTAGLPND